LDKEFSRPAEALHALALALLMSPPLGGRLDDWRANRLANVDVDSLGDYQKFPGVAKQGRPCQALADATVKEPFSGFGERTGTVSDDDTGIFE
jgi:hypothetical protein